MRSSFGPNQLNRPNDGNRARETQSSAGLLFADQSRRCLGWGAREDLQGEEIHQSAPPRTAQILGNTGAVVPAAIFSGLIFSGCLALDFFVTRVDQESRKS
jgi:hypothetical protein